MAETTVTIPDLGSLTSGQASDLLLATRGTTGYKMLLSDLAKYMVETYNGSTLAGSAQTPKSAIDSLNSRTAAFGYCTPFSSNLAGLYNSFSMTFNSNIRGGVFVCYVDGNGTGGGGYITWNTLFDDYEVYSLSGNFNPTVTLDDTNHKVTVKLMTAACFMAIPTVYSSFRVGYAMV